MTSVGSSIATTLGIGSGLDSSSIVDKLVAAEKSAKQTAITTRDTANKAKVSALADISSAIDSFASSLTSLVSGGTLFTQPTSSSSAVTATALAGSRIGSLAATIEVTQLAQGQSLVSAAGTGATAASAVGLGKLTITGPKGAVDVTIDAGNNSLSGLAKAINDAGAGVTATVLADSAGARLVIKGGTGAANSFTIATTGDASLAQFAYDGTSGSAMTRSQQAQDAKLKLDGTEVTRSSNTVTDLIDGVKLQLNATTGAIPAAIGSTQPIATMRQTVIDFVDTYNTLKKELTTQTASGVDGGAAGALKGDPGLRDMIRQLSSLTSAKLASGGSVSTLAEIGVSTNTDGTLAVNTDRLDKVLATDPDAVEAMFNPTQSSSSPLLQVTSAMGKTAPGSYTITDVTAGPPPAGKLNGVALTAVGDRLVATTKTGAAGLVLRPLGAVASATITVEPGIGGALQAIRDSLRATTGALTTSSDRFTTEAKSITADQTALDDRIAAYQARLQSSFGAMETRVAALKATQSYLTQQVALWTKSDN